MMKMITTAVRKPRPGMAARSSGCIPGRRSRRSAFQNTHSSHAVAIAGTVRKPGDEARLTQLRKLPHVLPMTSHGSGQVKELRGGRARDGRRGARRSRDRVRARGRGRRRRGRLSPVIVQRARRRRFVRLIMFDRRGTGLSDAVSTPPTLEQQMDDLNAVLEAVASDRIALFGASDLGLSALYAATYPERVTALVLAGVAAAGLGDDLSREPPSLPGCDREPLGRRDADGVVCP